MLEQFSSADGSVGRAGDKVWTAVVTRESAASIREGATVKSVVNYAAGNYAFKGASSLTKKLLVSKALASKPLVVLTPFAIVPVAAVAGTCYVTNKAIGHGIDKLQEKYSWENTEQSRLINEVYKEMGW